MGLNLTVIDLIISGTHGLRMLFGPSYMDGKLARTTRSLGDRTTPMVVDADSILRTDISC